MAQLTVDIGDYKISKISGDIVKTYALGSCIALIVYDRVMKIGGMIHCALPDSNVDLEKAKAKPAYFVDTGLPILFNQMKDEGAFIKNCYIKIAGGANIMDPKGVFDIGKRNVLAAKKWLWKYTLGPIAEDIGGDISRTVSLIIDTGEVIIQNKTDQWKI